MQSCQPVDPGQGGLGRRVQLPDALQEAMQCTCLPDSSSASMSEHLLCSGHGGKNQG